MRQSVLCVRLCCAWDCAVRETECRDCVVHAETVHMELTSIGVAK